MNGPSHLLQAEPGRDAGTPRYSIVVPVFNEADNIGLFCRRALAELPPDFELLVCYDFDGDSTLPALAALPPSETPPIVRLVKNELGRGVRYAIEAGMRAARAPIVVVMMADLSDDFAKVEAMVAKAEAGADVVCASRYMVGGQQIGGPRLKGFLSRMAGLTLHWFAGLPTHDPTNSFKAYRKSFLDRTPIESPAGFCLGLELTAKAHFGGGRVAEVPATWWDRTAGESRFLLRRWLPLYLRWYGWAFAQRYRAVVHGALLALVAVIVFLSNLFVPFATATALPEQGWQAALNHAFHQHWRTGVDYVFTYGPLGVLTTRAFDPALYWPRLVWEIALTGLVTVLAMRALRSHRPWPVRITLVVLLTLFRALALWELKSLFLMAGLAVLVLERPRPNRLAVGAILGLFTILALTKFTFFVHAAALGAILLIWVMRTRGPRSAALLAATSIAWLGLLWMATGQRLTDLPAFVQSSQWLANGYADAMHLDGPFAETIVAVIAGGLVAIAAAFRGPAGTPRMTRTLSSIAVGWLLFGFFKASFVRHEPDRAEAYFWLVSVLALWLWPAVAFGWRRKLATTFLTTAVALGLYGVCARSERWSVIGHWYATVRQSVALLTDPESRLAELTAETQLARAKSELPRIAALVGNRSIDMITNRPGVVLENGLNWTPRPVFQSYAACAPELQRLNCEFFRSPAAPDFVLFRGEPIDGRLFTQDDGPTVLELLRRYEPLIDENGYLLLERRTQAGPELLGEPLLECDVRFGETIDLAALGPAPKAISFQIAQSPSGRARNAAYRPPTVYLRVQRTNGESQPYRLTPGMVGEPILIDPLPATVEEYADLFRGRLPTSVRAITLDVDRPGLRRNFVEPVRCTVWPIRGLPKIADSHGDVGD